jgi:antitoxin MazE
VQAPKWGNSLAVRLPASVVEALELKEGDDIEIHAAGARAFVVSRTPDRQALLERLRTFRGSRRGASRWRRGAASAVRCRRKRGRPRRPPSLAEDRIAERDVDAEGLAVDFPGGLALGPEAKPVVLKLRVIFVGADLEREEVTQVATPRLLQPREGVVGRARHAEVDVLRGASTPDAELEGEPALQRCGIVEHGDDAREKRSNTSSCRLRANSAPDLAEVRRRCSTACLKASGDEYVRLVMRRALQTARARPRHHRARPS